MQVSVRRRFSREKARPVPSNLGVTMRGQRS